MPYAEVAIVHTEGDPEDILFTLPPGARQYHKGDVIRYVTNGDSVKYKVETVDSVVKAGIVNPNPNNDTVEHRQPEVYYGVTIV